MIDIKRVKKTRSGHEVRIYATDGGGEYPIHGAVLMDGGWRHKTWTKDGMFSLTGINHQYDLVEEPETVEVECWLNFYKHGAGVSWDTREGADRHAGDDRIACIHMKRTVTKGEGL